MPPLAAMMCAAQIVGFAGQADEVVLVVIGKAEDFVRHDVADVDDQVPGLFHQHAVEHDRDRPIGHAARGGANFGGRDFAERARSRSRQSWA